MPDGSLITEEIEDCVKCNLIYFLQYYWFFILNIWLKSRYLCIFFLNFRNFRIFFQEFPEIQEFPKILPGNSGKMFFLPEFPEIPGRKLRNFGITWENSQKFLNMKNTWRISCILQECLLGIFLQRISGNSIIGNSDFSSK